MRTTYVTFIDGTVAKVTPQTTQFRDGWLVLIFDDRRIEAFPAHEVKTVVVR